jgi:hypothetical protein
VVTFEQFFFAILPDTANERKIAIVSINSSSLRLMNSCRRSRDNPGKTHKPRGQKPAAGLLWRIYAANYSSRDDSDEGVASHGTASWAGE